MRQIRINIDQKINGTKIEERNAWNIPMIEDVITKREIKVCNPNVDICDNPRRIIEVWKVSREYYPTQVVRNTN